MAAASVRMLSVSLNVATALVYFVTYQNKNNSVIIVG
jgi:hypothetical protein